MREDPLFLGPTMPQLLFGVPYAALPVGFGTVLVGILFTNNIWLAGLLGPYFLVIRSLAADNPRIFAFAMLWIRTKLALMFWRPFGAGVISSFQPRRY